jgi:hypothetical protein
MGKWMAMLAVHADAYGGGTVTVIDTTRYLPSLWGLLVAEPIVALTIAVGTLLWLGGHRRRVLSRAPRADCAAAGRQTSGRPLSGAGVGTLGINPAPPGHSRGTGRPALRPLVRRRSPRCSFPIAHVRSQAAVLRGCATISSGRRT